MSTQVEAFFAPLAGDRYFRSAPRSTRHAVRRENPHILEALAADLDQAIGDLAFFLENLLRGFRDHKAGDQVREIALGLFNLWCEKSLLVSPIRAGEEVAQKLRREQISGRDLLRTVTELGFTGGEATLAADAIATRMENGNTLPMQLADGLWPAYDSAVKKLCAQSAHVVVARALLYRIGEDQCVFPRVLSGEEMEKALDMREPALLDANPPATDLLWRVRSSMESFLPTVYKLGEFDWWLAPPDKRATLASAERAWLRTMDGDLEGMAQRLLRMLNGYFWLFMI
jgi:hypothetical protein